MALNHCKQSQTGTTLIELVVSIGLFVILVTISTTITIDAWTTYFSLRGQSALVRSLIDAQDRVAQLVGTATATPNSVTIDGVSYTAGPDTFIASLPSVDALGAALAGSTDTLVYARTEEGLVEVLETGGGVRRDHHQLVIDASLVAVQFTLVPAGGGQAQPTLNLEIQAKATVPNRILTQTVTRTIVLENLP